MTKDSRAFSGQDLSPGLSKRPKLSPQVFELLRELIHNKLGLRFEPDKRELLEWKLAPRAEALGLGSFLDYYYLLKYDSSEEEWAALMDALCVPETYFWREPDQFEALAQVIAPRFFEARPDQTLSIWSAACCTGEEPLSVAIALKEAGWLDRKPIRIIASDASPAMIRAARRGVYRKRSFRNLPPALRDKYFEPAGEGLWRAKPEIKEKIVYRTANLMDPQSEKLAEVHVIFCRNVFIYFSEKAVQTIAERFYRRMLVPGWLFVGAAESLLKLTTGFLFEQIGSAFVYMKPEPGPAEGPGKDVSREETGSFPEVSPSAGEGRG